MVVDEKTAIDNIVTAIKKHMTVPGDIIRFTYHRFGEIGDPIFMLTRNDVTSRIQVPLPRFRVCELRDVTYIAGRGAWFQLSMKVFYDGDVEYLLDYDSTPTITLSSGKVLPLSAREVAAEFKNWPRDPQHTPHWLKELFLTGKLIG